MATRTIELYRMETPDHICPSGLKLRQFLISQRTLFEDHILRTRDEVDAFKQANNLETTPQLQVDGEYIGGYEASLEYFGKAKAKTPYQPVIAVFAVAFLLSFATGWLVSGSFITSQTILWFIALAMVLLGLQKLRDIDSFSDLFMTYDVLARKWPNYGKIYPILETGAGLFMFAGLFTIFVAPLTIAFAGIGAWSVYKAVYIEKRELKCACVGGDSATPLGFVSLMENVMMVAMAVWMLSTI